MPNTIERIVATAQKPAQDRTAEYCATIDKHLAGLRDDAARLAFCEAQETRWIGLYEAWAKAVDSGKLKQGPGAATAWDYTMTLAAIGERKARYAAAPPPVPADPEFWVGQQA